MICTRMAWLVGLVVSVTLRASGVETPPTASGTLPEASPEEFVQWVRESAIPVERWIMNPALETYLDEVLHDRRIVFLGEPGHFFQEKYDVQLMLIEHLARRGYRHLFVEGLGATTSEIVNDFVASSPLEK